MADSLSNDKIFKMVCKELIDWEHTLSTAPNKIYPSKVDLSLGGSGQGNLIFDTFGSQTFHPSEPISKSPKKATPETGTLFQSNKRIQISEKNKTLPSKLQTEPNQPQPKKTFDFTNGQSQDTMIASSNYPDSHSKYSKHSKQSKQQEKSGLEQERNDIKNKKIGDSGIIQLYKHKIQEARERFIGVISSDDLPPQMSKPLESAYMDKGCSLKRSKSTTSFKVKPNQTLPSEKSEIFEQSKQQAENRLKPRYSLQFQKQPVRSSYLMDRHQGLKTQGLVQENQNLVDQPDTLSSSYELSQYGKLGKKEEKIVSNLIRSVQSSGFNTPGICSGPQTPEKSKPTSRFLFQEEKSDSKDLKDFEHFLKIQYQKPSEITIHNDISNKQRLLSNSKIDIQETYNQILADTTSLVENNQTNCSQNLEPQKDENFKSKINKPEKSVVNDHARKINFSKKSLSGLDKSYFFEIEENGISRISDINEKENQIPETRKI